MATPSEVPTSEVVGTSKPRLLHRLGPGLIAGVANDDPVAIGSYSQIGARFGFGLCWLLVLVYPIMVVVQQISGRVGRTTGRGLAGNLAAFYPGWLLYLIVLLLVTANVIALAADLSIMAEVIRSLVGGRHLFYVVALGLLCVGLQIFMHYARYVAILKWITLSVLAYVGAVLLVGVFAMMVAFTIVRTRLAREDA